jgi:acyl-CoA dehydrogenase
MAEIMGHAPLICPQATNCAAPDTGNMEVLARYANPEQQKKYLLPLLDGQIRSASSDATNLATKIERKDGEVIVTGRKWVRRTETVRTRSEG